MPVWKVKIVGYFLGHHFEPRWTSRLTSLDFHHFQIVHGFEWHFMTNLRTAPYFVQIIMTTTAHSVTFPCWKNVIINITILLVLKKHRATLLLERAMRRPETTVGPCRHEVRDWKYHASGLGCVWFSPFTCCPRPFLDRPSPSKCKSPFFWLL